MNQNNLPKSQKSIFWMAKQIIFYLIGFGVVLGIPLIIILWFLVDKVPSSVLSLLSIVSSAVISFVAIRMAFKAIANQTILSLKQVLRIGQGVVLIVILVQVVTVLYPYLKDSSISFNVITLVSAVAWDAFLFFAIYYWGKRFIDQGSQS